MSPGPIFDRVYLALKAELMSGRFAPGDPLEPAALSTELAASITPVRDALHRLVGERMIETPRHDGFRLPAPTEAELRDLYGWNARLVGLAITGRDRRFPGSSEDGQLQEGEAPVLFRLIARRTGSAQHDRAVANLNDRLAALRLAERRLFPDHSAELAALWASWSAGDLAALRVGLGAYHRRRQRHVGPLIAGSRALALELAQTTRK